MTDRGITDLLMNLLALQDSVSVFVRSDRYDNRDVTVARAARDKVRDAILDEFATLRQQRDELAEALESLLEQNSRQNDMEEAGMRCSYPTKFPEWKQAWEQARAALASIEEAK